MEYKQIQELIKTINKSNISELSIKEGEFEITIKQELSVESPSMVAYQPAMVAAAPVALSAPAAVAAQPTVDAPAAATTSTGTPIKSPMIGTFYRSSSPDKPSFVNVGDEIVKGQVICIIEAMKLFNEIEAEVSGKIIKVLVDDATPVEYDQPLFLIES